MHLKTSISFLSIIIIVICLWFSSLTFAKDVKSKDKQNSFEKSDNKSKVGVNEGLVSLSDLFNILSDNSNSSKLSTKSLDSLPKIEENFIDISSKFKLDFEPIENQMKQLFTEYLSSMNLSQQCLHSIMQITNSIHNGQSWSFKFLDSSGKMPSGLSEGVMTSLGEYDQCLDIKSPQNPENSNIEPIRGKYCLVRPFLPFSAFDRLEDIRGFEFLDNTTNAIIMKDWKNNLNLIKVMVTYSTLSSDKIYLFHYGLCIPSKCSTKDLQNMLYHVIGSVIPIEVSKCDTIIDNHFLTNYQLCLLIIFILFIAFSFICTFLSKIKFNRIPVKTLRSFSLIAANKRLFGIRDHRLTIADGLMFAYLIWDLVRFHYGQIVASGFMGFKNIRSSFIVRVIEESKYFWLRSYMPRDSIFMLSGVLIAYDFFGPKQRPLTPKQYLKFVVQKYLRFLPKIIAPMILVNVSTIMASGPLWQNQSDCTDKAYWKSLFFLTNIGEKPTDNCNSISWFLSNIFQFHLISPLFMLPFKYSPRFGYITNMVILPIACFASIAPKFLYDLKLVPFEASEIHSLKEMKKSFWRFYFFPDQYIALFIMGIIVGYAMRNTKPIDMFLKNRNTRIFVGILCYITSILGIVWSENFKDMNEKQNELNLNLWFSFNKLFWMIGNIWIIYDIHTGKPGLIKGILSTKVFAALTRLSFGIFLSSNILFMWRIFTKRENVEISHSNQMQFYYIDLSIMIILSYIMFVFIEYPVINLIDIIKNKRKEGNCGKENGDIRGKTRHKENNVELKYVFE